MELFTWAKLQWDRALALLALVLGVVFILLGWIGVSNTPFIAKQVPFVVSGGIGGLALLVIGSALWLSADMNDEWRVLDRLEQDAQTQTHAEDEVVALKERVHALEVLLRQPSEPATTPPVNGSARRSRSNV